MTWIDFLYECVCWPFQRFQRHVLAWVLAVVVTLSLIHTSLMEGINGHQTCDFAGQWMHGRFFYREICPELYKIEPGKRMLAEGFQDKAYDEQVTSVLMKGYHRELFDEGLGGALYPPTAAILFSVLAVFIPSTAHALAVVFYILLCYASAWMISQMTGNRLQWGEACLLMLFFPNNFMGLMLGQNQQLTLWILVTGWYCRYRGWPFVAGLVWGLFAYKPVFAVAMVLVPLALRSPRWLMGMVISGGVFVLFTLPFTEGLEPWKRWLIVGKHAEQLYQLDRNWVWMSRDLVGLPRRQMWDPESFANVMTYNFGSWNPGYTWFVKTEDGGTFFRPDVWLFLGEKFDWKLHQRVYVQMDASEKEVPIWYLTLIGYLLLGGVALITVCLCWYCKLNVRTIDGPEAVFLLTGSLLCVFHFMHYDLASFSLPVMLTLASWSSWPLRRRILFVGWYLFWLSRTYAFFFGDGILEIPWETFALIVLWVWMGWITWKESRTASIFAL